MFSSILNEVILSRRTGSDTNNCASSTTPCKTIGHAIGLAAPGDSIMVAAGVYPENLTITSNVNLTGSGPARTIVDGRGVARVLSILSTTANVVLSKFTIRNGAAAGGGGILNWEHSPSARAQSPEMPL